MSYPTVAISISSSLVTSGPGVAFCHRAILALVSVKYSAKRMSFNPSSIRYDV